jgi:hypothetical protein
MDRSGGEAKCAKNRNAARAAQTKGTMKASYNDENRSEAQAHKARAQ